MIMISARNGILVFIKVCWLFLDLQKEALFFDILLMIGEPLTLIFLECKHVIFLILGVTENPVVAFPSTATFSETLAPAPTST